ncbi:MAG: glucuronate isomerase [Pontibacterium sp.]
MFISDDFLLSNDIARQLYHEFAKEQPIYDYHCHLSPREIAENRQFENIGQAWLEGDHYKWRALRAAGVDERLITGDATFKEKYEAWAITVPKCLGNPIYHWTHLELRRPFGISTLFSPESADQIWHQANECLAQPEFFARGIMQQMNVRMVGTTDDPTHSLEHHIAIKNDESFDIAVLPTWRPDRAFKVMLSGFGEYVEKLAKSADIDIACYEDFLAALTRRLAHFNALGCRSADHGIEEVCFAKVPSDTELNRLFKKRIAHQPLSEDEGAQLSTAIQVWLGQQYSALGWVMQLHIGAQRNNSSRMFKLLGPDSGFDSIGDQTYMRPLANLLDALDTTNELPKTILYCLNPRDNEAMATMAGNFQGSVAGKVQFGSGWWFNDQKDGMLRQMVSLSQLGLLSQFVGMLTDSRSFLSYTRHEYFRRILCELIGSWVVAGEAPNDIKLLSGLVEDICSNNTKRYFNLEE